MKLERITDTGHNLYQTALDLYHISFPFHEQREADSQANILHDQEYNFHVIYDKEIFVGMLLYWETERFIYIEHFCIYIISLVDCIYQLFYFDCFLNYVLLTNKMTDFII